MAVPTREELERWLEGYVTLWNAGDREAWLENWRRVCNGQVVMEDPVGTRVKRGGEECWTGPWELWNPITKFSLRDVFICGNEVAFVNDNHVTHEGKESVSPSIETYRFEPDGSVVIRTWWDVPSHSPLAPDYVA